MINSSHGSAYFVTSTAEALKENNPLSLLCVAVSPNRKN